MEFYGPQHFTYLPESDSYRCPAGQPLNYGGRNQRNRTYAYIGTRKRCGACSQKAQCTSGAFRYLAIHMDEPARQRARELVSTTAFAKAQRNGTRCGSSLGSIEQVLVRLDPKFPGGRDLSIPTFQRRCGK
jgi:hypothetical protein